MAGMVPPVKESGMKLKEWMQTNGWTAVSKVRSNANGYPFATVVNDDGDAENVYFSKRMAGEVELDAKATLWAKSVIVREVQNAAGELRVKLCSAVGEDYTSVDDL